MTVYLVRHALAVPRKRWTGDDDDDRPLTKRGLAQSQVLATWSTGLELSSILSSPTRRCLDTAAAIAAVHDLPVLARSELAVGDEQLAKDLVASLLADDADVLICTHGENILPTLQDLRPRATSGTKTVAAKGSVWALKRSDGEIMASYATNANLLRPDAPR